MAAPFTRRSSNSGGYTRPLSDKPWYVLACDGGYLVNHFELFNNSPRRPRIAVVESLQDAGIFSTNDAKTWQKLGAEVIGAECRPLPIKFVKRKGQDGKDWTEVLLQERGD